MLLVSLVFGVEGVGFRRLGFRVYFGRLGVLG